jgi:hypothetical protein
MARVRRVSVIASSAGLDVLRGARCSIRSPAGPAPRRLGGFCSLRRMAVRTSSLLGYEFLLGIGVSGQVALASGKRVGRTRRVVSGSARACGLCTCCRARVISPSWRRVQIFPTVRRNVLGSSGAGGRSTFLVLGAVSGGWRRFQLPACQSAILSAMIFVSACGGGFTPPPPMGDGVTLWNSICGVANRSFHSCVRRSKDVCVASWCSWLMAVATFR